MTFRQARIALFQATARLFGRARALRVSQKWAQALADPDLAADLAVLGYLGEAHAAPDGTALPANELQRREGARQLALAIFARAGLTAIEIHMAIEEMENEPDDDDPLDPDGGRGLPERARR